MNIGLRTIRSHVSAALVCGSLVALGGAMFGTAIFVAPVAAANVIDGGIRLQDSVCDWYELDWDEMTNAEQQAWMTLGWRSDNWGTEDPKAEPASSSKDWAELSRNERQAAQSLGFGPKTWNADPDPCQGK